jgi:salicylate hydroxylase
MTGVVIAGAGMAGLTAALALADAGLEITLADRAPALVEAGAGLQLSPNATRVLARLGLLDAIAEKAVKLEALRIRRGRDGGDVAGMPFGAVAEARFGSPFLVTHRADLQQVLVDAARAHPAITLTTGATVESYRLEGRQIAVTLRAGQATRMVTADGLIGADGLRSTIRAAMRLGQADEPIYCGRTAWRTLVPARGVPAFARLANSNLWLGPDAHLVHYPVRCGSLINMVAIVGDSWRDRDGGTDLWAVPGDPARLRKPFEGWAGGARALIGAGSEWRIWPLFDRPPFKTWSVGPVTLVGDAAHPMLPFLAQGAAQAIEDGWALGQAVRRHPQDLAAAFLAYEHKRRPTADRAQREARQQGSIYHLGQPAATLRDLAMRTLGARHLLARYDWLYGEPSPSAS